MPQQSWRIPRFSIPGAPRRAPRSVWRRWRQTLAALTVISAGSLLLASSPFAASAHPLRSAVSGVGAETLVIAHRGDPDVAPENTLAAIMAAIDAGAEYVEIDLQLTADRAPVLLHDRTLDRTTDGTGRVDEHSEAQLRRLDAGSWFSPAFAGEPVPSFAEAAELIAASPVTLVVELKEFWTGEDVLGIVDTIESNGIGDRVVLAASHFGTARALRDVAGDSPRALVRRMLPPSAVELAHELDVIAFLTTMRSIDAEPALLDELRDAGVAVVIYTLNAEQNWRWALDIGVDGIVTDDPSGLQDWLLAEG